MKLWIDDIRPSPEGYKHIHSVDEFVWLAEHTPDAVGIFGSGPYSYTDMEIDTDHDAGDFHKHGGDYMNIVSWLEANGYAEKPISWRIHSMNPVAVSRMKAAIGSHPAWTLV